jgi:alpha-2-macroglobulin
VVLELSTESALPMLALTDPLPAGLEPLDPALSTGSMAGCNTCDSASWGFDYVRRRDDRIDAFAEQLTPGTHVIRYLLRATTPGSFSAPAAEALPMYSPNRFARSDVGRVQITR